MKEQSYGFIPFYKDGPDLKVFLIHQYGSGGDTLWTFPKGRGEKDETPIQTAIRELKEETGLDMVSYDADSPVNTSYTFMRNGEQVEKTSTYYVGFAENKECVIQPEEVKEAGWFHIDEARERITFPDYKILLDEALDILDNQA
jgi:bis(5'-nucleosidyl)-tetraphosphatase